MLSFLLTVLKGRLLLDRDRVMSKTWFNEEKNRWEMEPIAIPYAVSKKLVESARIRHDWGAMYVILKGESKEYFVNIKVQLVLRSFDRYIALYYLLLNYTFYRNLTSNLKILGALMDYM